MKIRNYLSVKALIGLTICLGLVGGSLCLMLTTGAMLAFWPTLGLYLALSVGLAFFGISQNLSKTITGIITLITGLALIGAGATIAVIGALPTFGLSLLMGAILGTVGLIMLGDSVAFFTKSQTDLIRDKLLKFSGITEARITVEENQGYKTFVAHYVTKDGVALDHEVIMQYLQSQLPDYMVPNSLTHCAYESLPKPDEITKTPSLIPYFKNTFSILANTFFFTVGLALMGAAIAVLAITTGAALLTYWPAFVFLSVLGIGGASVLRSTNSGSLFFSVMTLLAGIALIGTAIALFIPGILPTLGLSILAGIFVGLQGIWFLGHGIYSSAVSIIKWVAGCDRSSPVDSPAHFSVTPPQTEMMQEAPKVRAGLRERGAVGGHSAALSSHDDDSDEDSSFPVPFPWYQRAGEI